MAIANSVAYNRSGDQITNVRTAVMRLGFRTMQSLAASVVVRQFSSKITNPALRAKATQLWEHTAHVAALAQVIARRVTHLDPETAMFAGIVHMTGTGWIAYTYGNPYADGFYGMAGIILFSVLGFFALMDSLLAEDDHF